MNRLDRRTFLLGAAAVGVAGACGTDEPSTRPEPRSGRVELLVAAFADGFASAPTIVAGRSQRLVFVVRDDLDYLRAEAPSTLDIEVVDANGAVITADTVAARSEGITTPYYPLSITISAPGEFAARVVGGEVPEVPFIVAAPGDVDIVQIGDAMRPVASPTTSDARGVDPICTRPTPCGFHELSLDEALTRPTPTVLVIATPGFCQTEACGPVVELLIEEADDRAGIDVIHAEVYADPSRFATGALPDVSETVSTYSLSYEPQLVVADSTGTITARLDFVWDRSELRAALDSIS